MKTSVRVFVWFALILSCLASLSCNTIRGMGEDIEAGGEEIQEAAE